MDVGYVMRFVLHRMLWGTKSFADTLLLKGDKTKYIVISHQLKIGVVYLSSPEHNSSQDELVLKVYVRRRLTEKRRPKAFILVI